NPKPRDLSFKLTKRAQYYAQLLQTPNHKSHEKILGCIRSLHTANPPPIQHSLPPLHKNNATHLCSPPYSEKNRAKPF
ncbi:hypothetical protein COCMIDRAFT_100020, partial [Bipolaris oryzae ATCC 44560]